MSAPDSFEEYVAARYAALTRTAYLLTGHHQDAEDLVQTVLMKAVPVWRRIGEDPEPYVRRMLVNENISRWRKHQGREQAVPEDAGSDSLLDNRSNIPVDDRLDLLDALRRLGPRQRTVLVLRYFEDLTEAQTAELMGTALGTVKSQARDALVRLRQLVPGLDIRIAPEVPADT